MKIKVTNILSNLCKVWQTFRLTGTAHTKYKFRVSPGYPLVQGTCPTLEKPGPWGPIGNLRWQDLPSTGGSAIPALGAMQEPIPDLKRSVLPIGIIHASWESRKPDLITGHETLKFVSIVATHPQIWHTLLTSSCATPLCWEICTLNTNVCSHLSRFSADVNVWTRPVCMFLYLTSHVPIVITQLTWRGKIAKFRLWS